MGQLSAVFAAARRERRAVLIGYLPAGCPTVADGAAVLRAMVHGGVDVVEVGWPYSDPLMDGPVIQQAVDLALRQGTGARQVLDTVQAVADTGTPTLVMTYWNPVERYGPERFARDLAAAGGCGAITPDLTPEEAVPWRQAATRHQVDPVFLIAPSSSDDRIRLVGTACRGFLYAASTLGVTGPRQQLGPRAALLVRRARGLVDLPIAVGLGVSDRGQAAQAAGFADGVVVGSAFVQRAATAADRAGAVRAVRDLAAELAAGVRHG